MNIIPILLLLFNLTPMLQDPAQLPDAWSQDFTITVTTTAMRGSSKLTLTHDSGEYVHESQPKVFNLSETDRIEILKKLKEFGIERAKSEAKLAPVYDGWSESICYGMYCVQAGSSTEMSDAHKEIFSKTYTYLQEFATKKLAKGKKEVS